MKLSVKHEIRFCFPVTFIHGAAKSASLAREIESAGADVSEVDGLNHRGFVVGAIIQAAAAMEAEIAEICLHGPAKTRNGDEFSEATKTKLLGLANMIDRQPTLDRYQIVLSLLELERFKKGAAPYQHADLLVQLRNEVVHYKSRWGGKMKNRDLPKSLEQLGHPRPPHISDTQPFFPLRCLSASCAEWSVQTATEFINAFYVKIGRQSRLAPYRQNIEELLATSSLGV